MAGHQPLLFLDFDDVICLNRPFGFYDVIAADPPPTPEVWERLFDAGASAILQEVISAWRPRVVITSSWLMFLDHGGMLALLERTRLPCVAPALHPAWEAPPARGMTRWQSINAWLLAHHRGEPFAILDDPRSGSGLMKSPAHRQGRVVWCEEGVGLQDHHIGLLESAWQKRTRSRHSQT